MWINTINR